MPYPDTLNFILSGRFQLGKLSFMQHDAHQIEYVILAGLVAVVGSWTALDLLQLLRERIGRRLVLLPAAAAAVSLSIFTTHFVAMLGFDIGIAVRYDPLLTAMSLLLAMAGSAVAFALVQDRPTSWARIAAAAVALGGAISLMHYVAIEAISTTASSYDDLLVIGSVLLAIMIAGPALRLGLDDKSLGLRLIGAVALGIAVVALHYTAIAAATFRVRPNPLVGDFYLDEVEIALIVGSAALLMLFLSRISVVFVRQREFQRVTELQQELNRATAVAALGTMAQTIAHELNQPLAAAANFLSGSERVARDFRPEKRELLEQGIAQANRQIHFAGEVIRRVRRLLVNEPPQREPVSLESLVSNALRIARVNPPCDRAIITTDLDPAADQVTVDSVQLEQVLLNLVRNGCQAVPNERQAKLWVRSRPGDDFTIIEVADNGPGLARVDEAELFQAFKTSSSGGLGVGLSICRTIVEGHGGKIWAENGPKGGASFYFTLPRSKSATQPVEATTRSRKGAAARVGSK